MTPSLSSLAEVTTALRSGAVLVLPTDTLPGLHGRADLPKVTARIARIKRRPADKPFLLLAGSLDQVRALTGRWPSEVATYSNRCWPGPHTLILPARTDLPLIFGSDATVAVRIPAVPLLRAAIIAVGYPLVSTSANRTGEQPQTDLTVAAGMFAAEIDGWWRPDPTAWDDESARGDSATEKSQPDRPNSEPEQTQRDDAAVGPSSLIDLCSWPPRLLRPGRTAPPSW